MKPTAPFNWRAVSVHYETPCYETMEPANAATMLGILSAIISRGGYATWQYQKGFGASEARNRSVRRFRDAKIELHRPRPTHLLLVDDDIECDPEVVVRMIERGVDIIGAPCRVKEFDVERYCFSPLPGEKVERGAIRCRGAGGGILLCSRKAVEAVCELDHGIQCGWGTTGHEKIPAVRGYHMNDGELVGAFDEMILDDGQKLFDDLAFCQRARWAGLDVWALVDVRTKHHGPNHPGWAGDFTADKALAIAAAQGGTAT